MAKKAPKKKTAAQIKAAKTLAAKKAAALKLLKDNEHISVFIPDNEQQDTEAAADGPQERSC